MIATMPKSVPLDEALSSAATNALAGSTRRKFLWDCSKILAAAVSPIGLAAESSEFEMKDISLDDLRYATFSKQAKSSFRVYADANRTVDLKLAKTALAKDRPARRGKRPGDAGNEKFSLLFTGPREALLQQGVYKFEHQKIGRFEMFITPVIPPENSRYYYEAVFNRPVRNKRG